MRLPVPVKMAQSRRQRRHAGVHRRRRHPYEIGRASVTFSLLSFAGKDEEPGNTLPAILHYGEPKLPKATQNGYDVV
jgi:hypothetical protein